MKFSVCKKCWQVFDDISLSACQKCGGGGAPPVLYPAVDFCQKLLTSLKQETIKNKQLTKQNNELTAKLSDLEFSYQMVAHTDTTQNAMIHHDKSQHIDLSKSDSLASPAQHQPLSLYFTKKHIKPTFDYEAVNASGYYDEAGFIIGRNYTLLRRFLSEIKSAYQKTYRNGTNFDLSTYNQYDQIFIHKTLKDFYTHGLFSEFRYDKKLKKAHIALQNAEPVRQFFMGGWLEWYVLSETLESIQSHKNPPLFSCAKNLKIQLLNGDIHELDFVLLNSYQELFVIECKTGNYRQDFNKYFRLCQKLSIGTKNFAILATDINQEQAKTMSAMYGIRMLSLDDVSHFIKLMLG
ncbi:MAG: hypothetical protein Q3971_03360 [Moraxella sp.]|nr:hypothetical protein [Moraxella sp.]